MLSLLVALALAQPPPGTASPDAVFKVAYLDLYSNIAPESRRTTRYLSLHAVPIARRADYVKAIRYAVNATSFRSEIARPVSIADDLLVRLDLTSVGWDRASRAKRIAELRRRGVSDAFNLDVWEEFAKVDPYFFPPTHRLADGSYANRGWIDPAVEYAARHLSYSSKFVLRGDWILPRLLQEKSFGGFYSDVLLFASKERDFDKGLLLDTDAINRDNQLRQGGAVLDSIVALRNRELQLTPSFYGQGGNRYYWKTLDVNEDARDKSVLEAFAGTLKHDGRESIGTLPNGLQWYRLFDGKGNSVDVVPESIAQIRRSALPPRDTRVISSYSCLQCHDRGIVGFQDVVRKAFLSPAATLQVKSKDGAYVATDLAAALEDYYNSELGNTIRIQQESYEARLKLACGMDGTQTAINVVGAIESYVHDLVDPEMAAREMGFPLDLAKIAWLRSGNPQLVVLSSGQPIRRAGWEASFADGMRAVVWPWEKKSHPFHD